MTLLCIIAPMAHHAGPAGETGATAPDRTERAGVPHPPVAIPAPCLRCTCVNLCPAAHPAPIAKRNTLHRSLNPVKRKSRNCLDQPPCRTLGRSHVVSLPLRAGRFMPKSLFVNPSEATNTPVTGHSDKTGYRAVPATMFIHPRPDGRTGAPAARPRAAAPDRTGRAGTVHHPGEYPPCSK